VAFIHVGEAECMDVGFSGHPTSLSNIISNTFSNEFISRPNFPSLYAT